MPAVIVQRGYIIACLQGGRLASVWVAGINRYGWPACVGIPSSHACLTEEAALLRKNTPKVLSPVEEMLACLSSETGMREANKKISTAMLKHWEDD